MRMYEEASRRSGADARAVIEDGRIVGSVHFQNVNQGEIGVVFDGITRFATRVTPASSGRMGFSVPLLGLRLPAEVNLEDLLTGKRLLPTPVVVDDAFEQGSMHLEGTTLVGGFSLAWAPHAFLPVQVLSGIEVIARGLARHTDTLWSGRAVFRFEAPLSSLMLDDAEVHLAVLERARPATSTRVRCPFSGYVDSVAGSEVSGWLVDTTEPGKKVDVDVRRGGRVVARTGTNVPRPDVAKVIPGATTCGFKVAIPEHERWHGGPYDIVVGGTETTLHSGRNVPVATVVGHAGRLDEALEGLVTGWAAASDAGGPVRIEVLHRGEVIAHGLADSFRPDLATAGLGAPYGFCAFAVRLPARGGITSGASVEVRANGRMLQNSPAVLQPNPNVSRFRQRATALNPAALPRLRAAMDYQVGREFVSLLILQDGEGSDDLLSATLSAVAAQWCSHWEFLYVHDRPLTPTVERLLKQFARRDSRFRVVQAKAPNHGHSMLTAGVGAARFAYVAELRHGDLLETDAVYHLLRGVRETGADVLYLDSYTFDPDTGSVLRVDLHTAFSANGFRTGPFAPGLLCSRKAVAELALEQELVVDRFTSAVLHMAGTVAHVPAIALARPPPRQSTAPDDEELPVFEGSLLVLVLAAVAPPWVADLPFSCQVNVLGEDATAASLNEEVRRAIKACEGLLLIGAGVIEPRLSTVVRLVSLLAQPDVAAVGPVLIGPNNRITAAGMVMGGPAVLSPGMTGSTAAQLGPVRDVAALPVEFVLARTLAWTRAGGIDPRFAPRSTGLADLCLRMAMHGAILLDERSSVEIDFPTALDADELLAFRARHEKALRKGDCWYHPYLEDDGSWVLRTAPCKITWPARLTIKRNVTNSEIISTSASMTPHPRSYENDVQ